MKKNNHQKKRKI